MRTVVRGLEKAVKPAFRPWLLPALENAAHVFSSIVQEAWLLLLLCCVFDMQSHSGSTQVRDYEPW